MAQRETEALAGLLRTVHAQTGRSLHDPRVVASHLGGVPAPAGRALPGVSR